MTDDEAASITLACVNRSSRQMTCGPRPLSDETLGAFIERVVMRLPEKQRPLMWRSAETVPPTQFMEPSYVRSVLFGRSLT